MFAYRHNISGHQAYIYIYIWVHIFTWGHRGLAMAHWGSRSPIFICGSLIKYFSIPWVSQGLVNPVILPHEWPWGILQPM